MPHDVHELLRVRERGRHEQRDDESGDPSNTPHDFFHLAMANSAAPPARNAAPTVACKRVAPNRIAIDSATASSGTTGPSGIVNGARPRRRSASTDAQVPV